MYDIAIVGLGAMGAAVSWHASRLGLTVLGIDQLEPPHTLGSTHAETRVTRLAVGEGDQYLPFVARSHDLWRELADASGAKLFYETGGHILTEASEDAERWTDFTARTAGIAARAGIGYEVFDGSELSRRHPQVRATSAAAVGFEPTAGIVMCERAVEVQLVLARAGGADLHMNERVLSVDPAASHVVVRTDQGSYEARHVVVATGPWVGELAPTAVREQLAVTRQVVYWFEAEDLDAWSTDRFPFLMWITRDIENYLGVFPVPPDTVTPAVKVLGEQFDVTTDPTTVNRNVSDREAADFHRRLLAPRFSGITDRCVRAEVCLYTNTPDDHFMIDSDPRSDRITIMSPCSGHGFKHSTALGEAVAQRVASGDSDLSLEPFRLSQ